MKIVVAIPAHDEAALIGRCLAALMPQRAPVVVLANHCADATAAVAAAAGARVVVDDDGPRGAGHARRRAVAAALSLGAEVVATTDADAVPDDDWLASLASAIAGVDAVAGRVSGDWDELQHQPAAALEIGALEWRYLAVLAKAEAMLDPRPHDPAPRHAQRCGANLAVTADALARVGGVPDVATGEDRLLLDALDAADLRVRFARAPHVTVSARTEGRAQGGMADALAARTGPDYRSDEQFEGAEALIRRLTLRHGARAAWAAGQWPAFAASAGLAAVAARPTFGATWQACEARTPALACVRLDRRALKDAVAALEARFGAD